MGTSTELVTDYKKLKSNDFLDEKDLKDYILLNKEIFCRDILKVEYKAHIEEFPLRPVSHLFDQPLYVDIVFIDTENYAHFIELKCPKSAFSELMRGVGQCLSYHLMARVRNIRLADVYLVSAVHCNMVPLIIRDNNLDIKYVYFDKTKHCVPLIGGMELQ